MTQTELAKIDGRGIEIRDTNDLATVVGMIVASELCPKQYRAKPRDAMIAILAGRQVGFGPIQSLQHIAVINGRPSLYGDGPTGLAHAGGNVEWIKEWWELNGQPCGEPQYTSLNDYPDGLARCWQGKRRDNAEPTPIARFSVGDAKAAGLWGKTGPWTQYPKRMLTCRARAWGLRDNFSDALQGISQAEEWEDMAPKHQPDPLEAPGTAQEATGTSEPPSPPPVERMPTPSQRGAFRKRVGIKRKGLSSLPDEDWIGLVVKAECGKQGLDSVNLQDFEQVGRALASGTYDWATGEAIPPATESPEAPDDVDAETGEVLGDQTEPEPAPE